MNNEMIDRGMKKLYELEKSGYEYTPFAIFEIILEAMKEEPEKFLTRPTDEEIEGRIKGKPMRCNCKDPDCLQCNYRAELIVKANEGICEEGYDYVGSGETLIFGRPYDIEFKGYISVDFDGTLSTYKRPFKYDKLGMPNKAVVDAVNYFYDEGYHINVFTGRQRTPLLLQWLEENRVKYDGINVNPIDIPLASPFKPYYSVIIDDKAIRFNHHEDKGPTELIAEIKQVLRWSKEK